MEFESEEFPRSLTEDILKYLAEQDYLCGEDDGLAADDQKYLPNVRQMIEQLIEKIARRAEYIEAYNAQLRAHNQYPLFNLKQLIPNFEIDDDLYNKMTFRETLVVGSFASCPTAQLPTIVGGLCLDVQSAKGKSPLLRQQSGLSQSVVELITNLIADKKIGEKSLSDHELDRFIVNLKPHYEKINCKFLVHLSSEFDVDGHQAGSRITAWVDRNLHTLEEKRQEFIFDDEMNEKMLYVGIQPRCYYVKHTHTATQLEDKKYYKMEDVPEMICEGSNFLLMRYLAITQYVGEFELTTLYINGDICRNIYKCSGVEAGIVNDQKLDLCKIQRTIIEECGIVHYSTTILTLHGQIVKQEWASCDYILQINPMAYIPNEKPIGNEHLLLRHVWEKDMQLMSKFLDCKTENTIDIKTYLADHPELKSMMADYIQQTLFIKPENILDFTIEHFKRFCQCNNFKRFCQCNDH